MPAAPRDWAEPFFEQAREDLAAARAVFSADSAATLCMLLQMVFEKMAKAAVARSGGAVPHRHQVVSRLFVALERDQRGHDLLRQHPNVRAFILQLEDAQPSVAKDLDAHGPRLEYPWEDATGAILYPAHDLNLAKRVRDPKDRIAQDCLKFATALEKELLNIIP